MNHFNDKADFPNKCPCGSCAKRWLGCHSDCQDYAEFKETVAEFNRLKRLESDKREYARPLGRARRH